MTLAERPHAPAVPILRDNTREKALSEKIIEKDLTKLQKGQFAIPGSSCFIVCFRLCDMLLLDHTVRPRRVCLSAKSRTLASAISHRARRKRPFGNRRCADREIACDDRINDIRFSSFHSYNRYFGFCFFCCRCGFFFSFFFALQFNPTLVTITIFYTCTCSGSRTLDPPSSRTLYVFLSAQAISVPTRR